MTGKSATPPATPPKIFGHSEQREARAKNAEARIKAKEAERRVRAKEARNDAARLKLQEREIALKEAIQRGAESPKPAPVDPDPVIAVEPTADKHELESHLWRALRISDKASDIAITSKAIMQLRGWGAEESAPEQPADDPIVAGMMQNAAKEHGLEKLLDAVGITPSEAMELLRERKPEEKS